MASKHTDLLQELRARYRYASDQWREAREERSTDMRYIAGDPWDPQDKKAREDAGRPAINHDELSQYINAAVNQVRQNKRGIAVEPKGSGANDKTAALRQDLIRSIEYNSNAQGTYCAAFQAMVEGSYGFLRLTRRYVSDASFEQEICIKNIPNPDSVLYDPDCKEMDWSDADYAFVLDPIDREEFPRRFPDAEIKDFGPEETRVAQDWLHERQVLIAEYWKVEKKPGRLYLLPSGEIVSDLKPHQNAVKSRTYEQKTVVQYITNGVEILERNEQPGTALPIIPFIGLQRYIDDGAGPKRRMFSLIRLARDPQMSHAYLCSQEMEEAGLTPKSPYMGYTGQFETDREAWETVTKIPHAYLQADPIVDQATGHVLPLPQRQSFTPNFQQYEIAKDSCRRAIQAAMGISPLPTAAQRNNEKSGVALEKITDAQNLGSYHFQDAFNAALQFAGRVIESWIPVVYDTEREVSLRQPDDSHKMVRINTDEPYTDPKTLEQQHYQVGDADHYVTVSTGPSYQSQREDAAAFLDQLIKNLKGLPVAPPQAQKLLALAIQMRQLGPKGDQMAEIISPPDQGQQLPPQAQQAIQQAQMHAQAMYAFVQKLQGEIQQLQLEKAGKVLDNRAKLTLEQMKLEAGIVQAEIDTKAQDTQEREQWQRDMWTELHGSAHDAALQADQQAHEQQMQQQQGQQQQALQQQQQATNDEGSTNE